MCDQIILWGIIKDIEIIEREMKKKQFIFSFTHQVFMIDVVFNLYIRYILFKKKISEVSIDIGLI